ncbi:hypothetical protein [Pontibacter ramchanderi]|uniref:hypothetical protein n=1 Tax=Pontibacter ramchanderi TaxID=1179743 RepID=UPI00117E18D9|nr:hypothetical protein [Pontibacter ramchanderi]
MTKREKCRYSDLSADQQSSGIENKIKPQRDAASGIGIDSERQRPLQPLPFYTYQPENFLPF